MPKKIGLVAYTGKKEAADFAEEIEKYLLNKGALVSSDKKGLLEAKVIIVLAGDGTVMHTAAQYAPSQTPVLGISPVRIGFLSATENGQAFSALDKLLSDDYQIDERMMLEAQFVSQNKQPSFFQVLNDVVIKGLTKLIDLEVLVDDSRLLSFQADGAIVASPTGSTAYSMAVGGPIAMPKVSALIFSAINPYSLPIPSILLNDESTVTINLLRGREVGFIPDGRERILMKPNDKIIIQKSQHKARLVKFSEGDFLDILNQRYHLDIRGRKRKGRLTKSLKI